MVLAAAGALVPMRAAEHALEREARLLGDAARGSVLGIDAQLHACGSSLVESQAACEHERARREAAASGVGAQPVADLRDAVIRDADPDRAEHTPRQRVGDGERLLLAAR